MRQTTPTYQINLNEIISETIAAIEYCENTDTIDYRLAKSIQLKLWESAPLISIEAVYLYKFIDSYLEHSVSPCCIVTNWDDIELFFENKCCIDMYEALDRAGLSA